MYVRKSTLPWELEGLNFIPHSARWHWEIYWRFLVLSFLIFTLKRLNRKIYRIHIKSWYEWITQIACFFTPPTHKRVLCQRFHYYFPSSYFHVLLLKTSNMLSTAWEDLSFPISYCNGKKNVLTTLEFQLSHFQERRINNIYHYYCILSLYCENQIKPL